MSRRNNSIENDLIGPACPQLDCKLVVIVIFFTRSGDGKWLLQQELSLRMTMCHHPELQPP